MRAFVRRIDGNQPRRLLENLRQLPEKLALKLLVRKRLAELHRPVIYMILRPQPEARLQEGQAGIVIVALGELLVELQGEAFQLRMRPIGKAGSLAFALPTRLLVIRQCIDVVRHRSFLTRIDEVEPENRLVPTVADGVQEPVHRTPIILAALFDDVVVLHVAVFELDGVGAVVLRGGPQDDAGHGLDMRDTALEGHGQEVVVCPGWDGDEQRQHQTQDCASKNRHG